MKRIFLFVFILTSLSTFALNLKVGLISTRIDKIDGIEVDTKTTLGLQAEIAKSLIGGELGGGISYGTKFKVKDKEQEFNQIPIYLLGRIYLSPERIPTRYISLKLGKTMYSGDYKIDNGNYYAIGYGFLGIAPWEINYSIREGKVGDKKIKLDAVSLSFNFMIF